MNNTNTIIGTAKNFFEQRNIGRARYTVSYHNGVKTHGDGSPFYDIRIFSNRRENDRFVKGLLQQGYKYR